MTPQERTATAPLGTIGRPTTKIDGVERVTGAANYTRDVELPGMLFAHVLRSPHPHACVRSVDVSTASALPGVRAILTRENCDVVWGAGSVSGGRQYSDEIKRITLHRRYLFNDPVRFVGDPVAAVAAVDRHVAEEAARLIDVDYELLPFVLDPEEALDPDAVRIWPEGNLSLNTRNEAEPNRSQRGDVEEAFRTADHVFEDRYSTAFVHNAQMEPRACVATWEGDKLTVYTPTGGIANCRHDMARDLDLPEENVRVVSQYMGGNFGNKNQNQDADLITAMLAREAGAPVKLEFSRRDDFLGMHGRWPTVQYYKVAVDRDGALQAIQLRNYSGMGPYRKNSGSISGITLYDCPNVDSAQHPVYTNRTVSGNFRGPSVPHGYFGIQSMMDEIAHELGMDPVEFTVSNIARTPGGGRTFTNYTLEECIRSGAEAFGWTERWRPEPGSDPGPIKRGAGLGIMMFRSGLGRSSAVIELDSRGQFKVFVGVTDVGGGAKTTMHMIATEALGVSPEQVELVWGDTDRCPFSVGESGSRTTIMTGYAIQEAVRDLEAQVTERGLPQGDEVIIADATPTPRLPQGVVRQAFAAHFAEVEVDTELGSARVVKYLAVHDSGRIMNPLAARSQVKGGVVMGIGQAFHEDLRYDGRSGQPLTAGYYGDRVPTHLDVPPEVDVMFIENDDGFGPYGAKSLGENGILPAPAAIANAVSNALGHRMKDLPITRDRILEVLA